jgi:hypothetical protein
MRQADGRGCALHWFPKSVGPGNRGYLESEYVKVYRGWGLEPPKSEALENDPG